MPSRSLLSLPFVPVHEWMAIGPDRQDKFFSGLSIVESNSQASVDRVQGALVGLSSGDALGAPLEFKSRSAVHTRYPSGLREMIASSAWRKGQFTDDTEMALLIAESLLQNRSLRPTNIAMRFHAWAQTANDVGIQTRAVVNAPGYVQAPETVARDYYSRNSRNSAGNGAVMRCAPVALFWIQNLPMLLADSRRSARLTHGDPKAQSSCVLLNVCIREAILNQVRDARSVAMKYLSSYEQKEWTRLLTIESLPEDQISSSGYTIHTVEAAFWSFLTTSSFEDAVVRAANLGDDADTVAAVTGALAGAYYGLDSIPAQWRADLEGEEMLRSTALRLAGLQ